VPGFGQRQWFFRAGFALRSLIHWPAYAPEPELPKNHGLRQLRHLAEAQARTWQEGLCQATEQPVLHSPPEQPGRAPRHT
jgi:hypothetical protein